MAAKKTALEELGEMLSHVVKHITEIRVEMATKEDLAEFRNEGTSKNWGHASDCHGVAPE